ncbi:MAG: hypothetical protein ABI741_04145 [Ferruginibacter sp.]
MSVAALNSKVEHSFGQMSKQFAPIYNYQGKTVSALKKALQITTDADTVKISKEVLENVTSFAKNLPTVDKGLKFDDIHKYIQHTNGNIDFVDKTTSIILSFVQDGGKVEIDDKNMLSFMKNVKEIHKILLYISDYLDLILEVKTAKDQLAIGKGIKYTLDELLDKLQAA